MSTGAGNDQVTILSSGQDNDALIHLSTCDGDDEIHARGVGGVFNSGAGTDTIAFSNYAHVSGGDGIDILTMYVDGNAPTETGLITLESQDLLHIEIADDLPGNIHVELSQYSIWGYGFTRGGMVGLDIYLTDTANPDIDGLTPFARIPMGSYETVTGAGGTFTDYNGIETVNLTFNRDQISGWEQGDAVPS